MKRIVKPTLKTKKITPKRTKKVKEKPGVYSKFSKKRGIHSELSQREQFKKYLERIEDPNYQGGSWALPENPTTSEKTKYELCEKVIKYKRNNKFTTEKLAQKLQLSKAETEDILYCRIDYLTLDRLLSYTDKLFAPSQVEIIIKEPKPRKRNTLYA